MEPLTTNEVQRVADYQDEVSEPGMFEGEPRWAPHFWEGVMNGGSDATYERRDGTIVDTFDIVPDDVRLFPELRTVKRVSIWRTSDGFVQTRAK